MTRTEYDAVVVGSGPNGLLAAAVLGGAGWRVLLVEAAPVAGGGLRTEELTLPGFRHDVCSSVHPLAVASPAFRALGLEGEGLAFAHGPLPLAHPLDGVPAALLHRDLDRTARGLGADAARWRRLFGPVVRQGLPLVDALMSPVQPWRDPLRLAGFATVGAWPATALARTAFREAPARALFAGVAGHSVLDLRAPVTAGYGLLLAGLGHLVGWPVAVGGSQAIADALLARLARLGVQVQTGWRVRRLAELPPARAVVLDLTPRQVLRIAEGTLPPGYARALARYRYGPGVFKIDWACDGPVPWRDPAVGGAVTVHLGGRLEEIAASERAVARGRHPERPYVLVVQACVADPGRAPAGRHTVWAYCHVPNASPVNMTRAIEAQLERFAPGFRERVLARHVMGPAALEAHNPNAVGGDIVGGSAALRQFLARPTLSLTPWATPVRGLYLCSASTPPGAGVHGMGGWHAAHEVLRRTSVPTRMRTV